MARRAVATTILGLAATTNTAAEAPATVAAAPRIQRDMLPLHVSGRYIVARDGHTRVKLACVNWGGAQLSKRVPSGLHMRTPEYLAAALVSIGFNCVRLVYSLQALQDPVLDDFWIGNAGGDRSHWVNPSLQGLSALQVLDAVVLACVEAGLAVILNNHNSDAGWCCSLDDENGLWWNDRYPAHDWLDHVHNLTRRYSNPRYEGMVVGFDLRNEIRPAKVAGRWRNGFWGDAEQDEDWRAAAIEASRLVLLGSKMLAIIEGLEFSTALCGLAAEPVPQWMANRTVYSAHQYIWTQMGYEVPTEIFRALGSVDPTRSAGLWLLVSMVCGFCLLRRQSQRHGLWTMLSAFWTAGGCMFLLSALASITDGCTRDWRISIVVGEVLATTAMLFGTGCLPFAIVRSCTARRGTFSSQCERDVSLQPLHSFEGVTAFLASTDAEPDDSHNVTSAHGDQLRRKIQSLQHAVSPTWRHLLALDIVTLPLVLMLAASLVRQANRSPWAYRWEMRQKWGRLLTESPSRPVWIGEYGPEDMELQAEYFLNTDVDLAYWQMGGENGRWPDGAFKEDTYGIFMLDYNVSNLRQPPRVLDLIRATFQPRVTMVHGHDDDSAALEEQDDFVVYG